MHARNTLMNGADMVLSRFHTEAWREELGRIIEAVCRKNIGRIQGLQKVGERLRFTIPLETNAIKVSFYCSDAPLQKGQPGFLHIQVTCRDRHGLWGGLLDYDGKLSGRAIGFMGVVADAAQNFGECEVVLPETLFE